MWLARIPTGKVRVALRYKERQPNQSTDVVREDPLTLKRSLPIGINILPASISAENERFSVATAIPLLYFPRMTTTVLVESSRKMPSMRLSPPCE